MSTGCAPFAGRVGANALSAPPGEYGRKAETQTELTGARTSGGACGSIRRNAKNLTWARSAVDRGGNIPFRKDRCGGAAWLSSARVVRCWVKSRNERNPYHQLPPGQAEHSGETASDNEEEGGDDVKSSWPLCPGLHTCYNARYKPSQTREGELIGKSRAQFGLESATRLHEAGIASNRRSARCGEYVPGPCTHRPSHHESGPY